MSKENDDLTQDPIEKNDARENAADETLKRRRFLKDVGKAGAAASLAHFMVLGKGGEQVLAHEQGCNPSNTDVCDMGDPSEFDPDVCSPASYNVLTQTYTPESGDSCSGPGETQTDADECVDLGPTLDGGDECKEYAPYYDVDE